MTRAVPTIAGVVACACVVTLSTAAAAEVTPPGTPPRTADALELRAMPIVLGAAGALVGAVPLIVFSTLPMAGSMGAYLSLIFGSAALPPVCSAVGAGVGGALSDGSVVGPAVGGFVGSSAGLVIGAVAGAVVAYATGNSYILPNTTFVAVGVGVGATLGGAAGPAAYGMAANIWGGPVAQAVE